jgi:hypothetical protein
MVKERLDTFGFGDNTIVVEDWEQGEVGRISIDIIEGNVVITVKREDVEKFGPVSTVVI